MDGRWEDFRMCSLLMIVMFRRGGGKNPLTCQRRSDAFEHARWWATLFILSQPCPNRVNSFPNEEQDGLTNPPMHGGKINFQQAAGRSYRHRHRH
jgi:hypothetical protein